MVKCQSNIHLEIRPLANDRMSVRSTGLCQSRLQAVKIDLVLGSISARFSSRPIFSQDSRLPVAHVVEPGRKQSDNISLRIQEKLK